MLCKTPSGQVRKQNGKHAFVASFYGAASLDNDSNPFKRWKKFFQWDISRAFTPTNELKSDKTNFHDIIIPNRKHKLKVESEWKSVVYEI